MELYAKFLELYDAYAAGVAYIAVRNPDGDEKIGTAFHVGDGVYITARHVVEHNEILEIATTEKAFDTSGYRAEAGPRLLNITHSPGKGKLVGGPYFHPEKTIDVAALKVEGISAPTIPLGDHLDDLLGTELVLRPVLIMGYPPIPFADRPVLVATVAEVNAVVNKYTGGHPHFILSAMARGGFSGGLAITDYECALGVITESLNANGKPTELGYLAVLSVQPIFVCLGHHRIMPEQMRKQWLRAGDDKTIWEE